MNRMAPWIHAGVFAGLLAGCGGEPGSDAAKVTTGIYQLKVTVQSDTCTPARFTGERSVEVIASPGGLVLSEASDTYSEKYELLAAQGYSLQVPRPGENINPCPTVTGDSFLKTRTLLAASDKRIEVAAVDDWTVTAACTAGSQVPASSCRSERTFIYELQEECKSPCTIRSASPAALGALRCDCTSQ